METKTIPDELKLVHPKTLAVKRFLGEDQFNIQVEALGIDGAVYNTLIIADLTDPITGKYGTQEELDNFKKELVKVQGVTHKKTIPTYEDIHAATQTLMDGCHGAAWNAGWWHDLETGEVLERNMGELLALMHSELSEALEGHRKGLMDDKLPEHEMVPVELMDCAIRIFDCLGALYPEAGGILAEKMKFNATRSDHKIENRLKEGGKKI